MAVQVDRAADVPVSHLIRGGAREVAAGARDQPLERQIRGPLARVFDPGPRSDGCSSCPAYAFETHSVDRAAPPAGCRGRGMDMGARSAMTRASSALVLPWPW